MHGYNVIESIHSSLCMYFKISVHVYYTMLLNIPYTLTMHVQTHTPYSCKHYSSLSHILHTTHALMHTYVHHIPTTRALRYTHVYSYPHITIYTSLVPRPEKRAWYTLSAHAPKCTENPGTSYISVKQSVNYGTWLTISC